MLRDALVAAHLAAFFSSAASRPCSPTSIARPSIPGASIIALTAGEYHDYSTSVPLVGANLDRKVEGSFNISFCNINVTYTHPGWNDTVDVTVWLPLHGWNGRFQGTGGGGWDTESGSVFLAPAVASGYATGATDGGHPEGLQHPTWGLLSPGNVDYYLLQDFAARSLSDMTLIGQALTASYYGRPASFSYWTGCSTGGRQGLMLAQRYPDLYDGILALAPAINRDSFIWAEYWAQHVMDKLHYYPPCELEAFTAAAISACDGHDGVLDRILSNPQLCGFDPWSLVGQTFACNGNTLKKFTSSGAAVVSAAWTGPVTISGSRQWYGLNHDANLTDGLVRTTTSGNGTTTGLPFSIATDWIKYFVAKNESFDPTHVSDAEYFELLRHSRAEYRSILGTQDPDLSAFRDRGGKMITWHGLADQLIFPNGTVEYYTRVLDTLPDVHSFYRLFLAPGVQHCAPGNGPYPIDQMESLVEWVEHKKSPDVLRTMSLTERGEGKSTSRNLCPWPKSQQYLGGNPRQERSFTCV